MTVTSPNQAAVSESGCRVRVRLPCPSQAAVSESGCTASGVRRCTSANRSESLSLSESIRVDPSLGARPRTSAYRRTALGCSTAQLSKSGTTVRNSCTPNQPEVLATESESRAESFYHVRVSETSQAAVSECPSHAAVS